MYVYVDIDGTIAGRNSYVFQKVCIRRLELALTPTRGLSYQQFIQFPELIAYKQKVGEDEFRDQLIWADMDPESLMNSKVLPYALEGVLQLAHIPASIGYCTSRYTRRPEWLTRNEEMAEATKGWLHAHTFVNPTEVIFCRNKIPTLWEHHQKEKLVVLIDDQYTTLIQQFAQIERNDPTRKWAREHFILVAYGTEEFPSDSYGLGLRVLPLSSWKQVHILVEYLQGGQ